MYYWIVDLLPILVSNRPSFSLPLSPNFAPSCQQLLLPPVTDFRSHLSTTLSPSVTTHSHITHTPTTHLSYTHTHLPRTHKSPMPLPQTCHPLTHLPRDHPHTTHLLAARAQTHTHTSLIHLSHSHITNTLVTHTHTPLTHLSHTHTVMLSPSCPRR